MARIDFFGSVISTLDSIQSLEQVKSGKAKVDMIDLTKHVYDFTKAQSCKNTNALPELVTEGFDEEQIWQQLKLQNEDEITHLSNEISKVIANNQKLIIPVSSMKPEFMQIENDNLEQENEGISDDNNLEQENEGISDDNNLEQGNEGISDDNNLEQENEGIPDENNLEQENEGISDDKESESETEEIKGNLRKRKHDKKEKNKTRRIKELEEEAIGEKPWQLKGEVSGPNRPQNSLLEEFVEIDVNTKPAPAITEETTIKLEDIIKQRIKDKAWDDVEKKFKPVETPLEYKKKLILDQEKSKESLSQIYEKEYLKQKQTLDPENNEKKQEDSQLRSEIQQMMRSLMSKLDALSNYHYTPKLAKPEIKIISNVPAIRMEEVAPVTTSDATLLAPEEIKTKPRGDVIGKSERTKTDMKRERRRKKLKQQIKQQAIEKKEKLKTLKPGISKKYEDKKERATLLKKVTKDKNVTKLDETTHKVAKSSTAFFEQLQNQVKNKIKRKDSSTKKKNNIGSAVKLKL
ncbi:U3 small nucleolar ribonucleoprotein MPP10 [Formica fusca]